MIIVRITGVIHMMLNSVIHIVHQNALGYVNSQVRNCIVRVIVPLIASSDVDASNKPPENDSIYSCVGNLFNHLFSFLVDARAMWLNNIIVLASIHVCSSIVIQFIMDTARRLVRVIIAHLDTISVIRVSISMPIYTVWINNSYIQVAQIFMPISAKALIVKMISLSLGVSVYSILE